MPAKSRSKRNQGAHYAGRVRGANALVFCLLALSLAAFPVLPAPASAAPEGVIQGIVRDSGGGRLAGATVLLELGSADRSATSGPDGTYRFNAVPHGVYSLRVECPGHSPVNRTGLSFTAGAALTVNVVLPVLPSLGGVQFYDHTNLTPAELENPTAGGGYSDAASTQGDRMVKQYIFSGASPSAANSPGTAPIAAEPGIKSAEALLARRDFAGAARDFGTALKRNPRSGRAATGLGLALYGEGKYNAAIDALERAAALTPSDPSPRLLMAEAARFTPARQAEVARQLAAFTASHASSASGHYAYAIVLWELFQRGHSPATFARSRVECERAASLDPRDAGALYQLGVIYDHEGRWDDAIRAYRKASLLDPERASTRYHLALDLFHAGQIEQARNEMKVYETLEKAAPK